MAKEVLGNSKMDNLYSVGGPLTNSVRKASDLQLGSVAINSGVVRGKVQTTDQWSTHNNMQYGVNLDKGSDTTKEPSSGSY